MSTASEAAHFPPGPPHVTGMLNKLRLGIQFRTNMLGVIRGRLETYGDLYMFHVDDTRYYILTHPDDIHRVLVTDAAKYHKDPGYKDQKRGLASFLGNGLLTSDGEFWKRQRKLIQPAFHAKRLEAYANVMVEFAEGTIGRWQDGAWIDVDEQMMKLTLDIVARTLFNTDVSSEADRIGKAMTVLQHMFSDFKNLPPWLPTLARLRQRRALRDLNEIVYGLIDAWQAQGEDRGDLLSMLMLARDDEGNGMTREQVRDEAVTLMLAGHETTANALNWTWYLLAQHPEVEAKLHAELDRVLNGRAPTLDDLKDLKYTEMVIKESMRLYPPAFGFGREAIEDTTIRDYPVKKGTMISVMTFATHRDARWWPEPDTFRPERFSEENEKAIPRYAYLPFGGGPRVCIGNSFAMMEARLALATMARRYRLKLEPGQTVKPDPLITLRPKGGLRMQVEARSLAAPLAEDALETAAV